MPVYSGVRVSEAFNSRDLVSARDTSSSEITLIFWITDTTSEESARTALDSHLNAQGWSDGVVDLLIRTKTVKRLGPKVFEGSVHYTDSAADDQKPSPNGGGAASNGEYMFSFETTGGTHHVTQSLDTRRYPSGAGVPLPAPDFHNAINVSMDGTTKRVEGTDVVVPKLRLTIRKSFPHSFLTVAYVKTLARLTGTSNSNTNFLGFGIGELLFLGATGSNKITIKPSQPIPIVPGDVEVQFHFEANQTISNLLFSSPAGTITVPTKYGDEYLWVLYKPVWDAPSKTICQQPMAVYVERLYERTDFTQLGI